MRRQIVAALLAATSLLWPRTAAGAEGDPVRVFLSNGYRAVFDELAPACERDIGRSFTLQTGTSTSLIARVNAGEAFDVAIMTTEAMESLGQAGQVSARVALGRSGIGIGRRAGAPSPDISNAGSLRKTFLDSKGVAYAGDGASRPHIERMMTTLGIAEAMSRKTILEQGSVRAAARVAGGDAELLITLVSEILPAPGLELVGPLPRQFQNYVSFAAATSVKAASPDAGKSLVACMSGPKAAATLTAKGMEKP